MLENIPVSKDLLISFAIGIEMSSGMSFKILAGMLLGPSDFDVEKDLIILMTSSGLSMQWSYFTRMCTKKKL